MTASPLPAVSCLRFSLCAALLLSGCSLHRTAARVTSRVIDKGLPSIFRQSDTQYVKESSLKAILDYIEVLKTAGLVALR